MAKQSFGIVGLGVMGENLALNIESHGFSVVGFDLDGKKSTTSRPEPKASRWWPRARGRVCRQLDTPRRC